MSLTRGEFVDHLAEIGIVGMAREGIIDYIIEGGGSGGVDPDAVKSVDGVTPDVNGNVDLKAYTPTNNQSK